MATTTDTPNDPPQSDYFNPDIPGLEALLLQSGKVSEEDSTEKGFIYYTDHGLNIVLFGPAGVGKTILALQMAYAAASNNKRVIYLTKDTPARVLAERIHELFECFGNDFKLKEWKPEEPNSDDQKTTDEEVVPLLFLNELLDDSRRNANGEEREGRGRKSFRERVEIPPGRFFAFADFNEVQGFIGSVDRYLMADSIYSALAHIQPELRPVFHAMDEQSRENLFVVWDALSVEALEQNLQLQASYDSHFTKEDCSIAPIFVFIMESQSMPDSMSVAFSPDIQIRLGIRRESHDITTRTIQLVKTRFQKSLGEEAPFVIMAKDNSQNCAYERVVRKTEDGEWTVDEDRDEKWAPLIFARRRPGIEIMPPLTHEAANLGEMGDWPVNDIRFCIKGLDDFTDRGCLAGGGCTLLVTQNRCGSTALGLHYLLGTMGETLAVMDSKPELVVDPRLFSVLYISFSDNIDEILHTIWRLPRLRRTILQESQASEKSPSEMFKNLVIKLRKELGQIKEGRENTVPQRHRLYKIPLCDQLEDGGNCGKGRALLYIYIPDFSWITAEEAMKRVVKLLQTNNSSSGSGKSPGKHLAIQRIVMDRVGRMQARWPLVQDSDVFIASLVAFCGGHHIELMLVDDTATEERNTGILHSKWESTAQSTLRLRRIPFHGTETITIELVQASGRVIKNNRPHEVVFHGDPVRFNEEMAVEDNFRGYISLTSGEPVRCHFKVDLSYDQELTPLYYEVQNTREHLQDAMNTVDVRTIGLGLLSGNNSAFNNFSSASRDTCHIVAIDGIRLQNLLENRILHQLSNTELNVVMEGQLGQAELKDDDETKKNLEEIYVTRSLSVCDANISAKAGEDLKGLGPSFRRAIPMRHNWGVLAVARLSREFMADIFESLAKAVDLPAHKKLTLEESSQARTKPNADNSGSSESSTDDREQNVLRLLLGREPKDRIAKKIYETIWGSPGNSEGKDPLTWKEIADFRIAFWHPFWKGGWINPLLEQAARSKDERTLWMLLFPRIDLFGIATTTQESIVSFLLELLLSNVTWDELFHNLAPPGEPARLCIRVDCEDGFTETLMLFYRLLSPAQRRQLGIGLRPTQSDIGAGLRERMLKDNHGATAFSAWPRRIDLLSRQWITTIQDLMPRNDIRESVSMLPLPIGSAEAVKSFWDKVGYPGETPQSGPTVAGTWYLGILKGGNTDSGAEVMKEILSNEHERRRLFNRCGAPVSKEFYNEDYIGGDSAQDNGEVSEQHHLPYASVLRRIFEAKSNGGMSVFFPFYRSQITDYLEVSDVLYDLARHVMRLQVEKEEVLGDESDPAFEALQVRVAELVKRAFSRLKTAGRKTKDSECRSCHI